MMSTSAVWKLESDNIFPTNCFPARGVARRLNEGASSWLVAYAEEQQSKFAASFKPTSQINTQDDIVRQNFNSLADLADEANTLDGDFLIRKHQVESALDLCSVNVSDQNLEHTRQEDFKKFSNVAYMNAAENLLQFRPFKEFYNLRELELPVNGLRNLQVGYGDFPNLQVLDLSYNYISAKDALNLGILPKLKVLTLTGNGMHAIHPDMARPIILPNSGEEPQIIPRFQSLEVLLLDDNHLSDLSTFASLAALPQLRELNLDKNGIELIPHLKVVGDRVISETHSSLGNLNSVASSGRKSRSSRQTISGRTVKPPKTEESQTLENTRNMATSTTLLQEKVEEKRGETQESAVTFDLTNAGDTSTPNPPFQNLRLLSIAHNLISEEECVLAVAAWPRLKHLVMHGNPIIKLNRGVPPLISHYLRNRLGVSVHRFQPKAPLVKPHLVMPVDNGRKVTTYIPKIPKQPVDALIKSLTASKLETLLESSQPATPPPSKVDLKLPSISNEDMKDKPVEENIFLTQVDEIPTEPTFPEKQKTKKKLKKESKKEESPNVDPRYKGYEILLDARPDSSLHEPMGIQSNIRALQLALNHPVLYRTSDVTLDRVLPCYEVKPPRHAQAMAVVRDRANQQRPAKAQEFQEGLSKIRKRKTVSIDVPLVDALYKGSKLISKDEAENLLVEVEEKYRVVREKSLRASQRIQDVSGELQKRGF